MTSIDRRVTELRFAIGDRVMIRSLNPMSELAYRDGTIIDILPGLQYPYIIAVDGYLGSDGEMAFAANEVRERRPDDPVKEHP